MSASVVPTRPGLVGRLLGRETELDRASGIRREEAAVWAIDRVLRTFRLTCAPSVTGARGLVRCRIGLDSVRIDLTAPTASAPEPWTASEGGRVVTAPIAALQAIALPDAGSTGLGVVVAVGTDAEGTVLVDLAAVGGVVAVEGDRRAARAVVARIVDQVATDPWSSGSRILVVGLRRGRLPAGRGVTLAEAVDAVRSGGTGGVVVLGGAVHEESARELAALLDQPGNAWGAVALGDTPVARWRIDARADGVASSAELGTVRWADIALSDAARASARDDETGGRRSGATTRTEASARSGRGGRERRTG